jgi:hypothetical protein
VFDSSVDLDTRALLDRRSTEARTLAAVVEQESAPEYVRVMWANTLLSATFALYPVIAIPLAVQATEPITDRVLRACVLVVGIAVAVGVCALVVVRTARLGVFPRPEGLLVRGILRSRTYPWAVIINTTAETRTSARGQTYYLPTLIVGLPEPVDRLALVVLPPDQRRIEYWHIGLIWLSAATEKTAQRRARRVQLMINAAGPADQAPAPH